MGIRSDISRIQSCETAIWTRRGLVMVASWRVAMPIGLKPSASIRPNRDRHSAHPLMVMPDSASGRGARCERAPGLLPRRQWIWHVLADVTGLKGGSRRRNPLGLGAVEEVAWSRLAALGERHTKLLSPYGARPPGGSLVQHLMCMEAQIVHREEAVNYPRMRRVTIPQISLSKRTKQILLGVVGTTHRIRRRPLCSRWLDVPVTTAWIDQNGNRMPSTNWGVWIFARNDRSAARPPPGWKKSCAIRSLKQEQPTEECVGGIVTVEVNRVAGRNTQFVVDASEARCAQKP